MSFALNRDRSNDFNNYCWTNCLIEKDHFYWNLSSDKNTNQVKLTVYYETEAYSQHNQTSEVELFLRIVNSFQTLNIFAKYSNLGVLNVFSVPLYEMRKRTFLLNITWKRIHAHIAQN